MTLFGNPRILVRIVIGRILKDSAIDLSRIEKNRGEFAIDLAVDEHIMQIRVDVPVLPESFQDFQRLPVRH